jgi:prepilin-type N-terminal cleavage/methylation domain-containing protein
MIRSKTINRRGFTFVEVIAAAAMLAILLALAGQILVQARRNSRIAEHRALALRTVENGLEELTARPWNEIDDDAVTQLALPQPLARRWPQAKFSGSVEELADPAPSKRLSLRLDLTSNQPALAAKLTTWIFRATPN